MFRGSIRRIVLFLGSILVAGTLAPLFAIIILKPVVQLLCEETYIDPTKTHIMSVPPPCLIFNVDVGLLILIPIVVISIVVSYLLLDIIFKKLIPTN